MEVKNMKRKNIAIAIVAGFILTVATMCFLLQSATARTARGWLGVNVTEMTPSMRDDYELNDRFGLLITHVMHNSPAAQANLKEDDVILRFNDTAVEKTDILAGLVRDSEPGTTARLLVVRDGSEQTVEVVIAKQRTRHTANFNHDFSWRLDDPMGLSGRPRLGVRVHEIDSDLAEYFDVSANQGVLVAEVVADSPAEKAGIKAGDVITRIDDATITDPKQLIEVLSDYEKGETVTIGYIRKGKTASVKVELQDSGRFDLGIEKMVDDLDVKIRHAIPRIEDHLIMFLDRHGHENHSL
jgi:serine protease Do